MNRLTYGLLLSSLVLAGCASHPNSDTVLQQAGSDFQKVKEDSNVLRIAPKDVIRAGESLARADRLSSYWGSGGDVVHYAYLSQRYSAIAREHTELVLNEERAAKLELERQRLQLALREAKLLSVQQQGKWLEEQIASLTTTQTDRGLVMTLGDVLFDTGQAELKNSANRTVLKIVQFLQLNPKRVVRIEGYTDSVGSASFNQTLSERRAAAVQQALIQRGVAADRIVARGYGKDFPVADNSSDEGRAMNRRVEIVIADENGNLRSRR